MAKQRRKRGIAGDKSICLPIAAALNYETLVADREAFRQYLNEQIAAHPELFPEGIESGYRFHGWVVSARQHLKTRRILLPQTGDAYQLRPDFVMPYMSETAEMADKALYLRTHGLSFEGIADVLRRSETHWYRLCQALGRASIVGSTVKTAAVLPPHLVADEKHCDWQGQRVYLAVTAAQGCVLGASLSASAGQDGLTKAYRVFQQEATHHAPDYAPETVTTDGWDATRAAWET